MLKVGEIEEVYYSPGRADYYMGDYGDGTQYQHSFPNAAVVIKKGKDAGDKFLPADELFNKYNIKLISWEPSPPIKNTFK